MRFLLDMPVSVLLREVLSKWGHTCVHASEVGLAMGRDEELMARARVEGEVIITADLDYPRLLALGKSTSPAVILFRGGQFSEAEMRELLERVLAAIEPEEIARSMIVVDSQRIRRRRLPI
jgi:predicted nuclease of predicted toxin-antitoxin system